MKCHPNPLENRLAVKREQMSFGVRLYTYTRTLSISKTSVVTLHEMFCDTYVRWAILVLRYINVQPHPPHPSTCFSPTTLAMPRCDPKDQDCDPTRNGSQPQVQEDDKHHPNRKPTVKCHPNPLENRLAMKREQMSFGVGLYTYTRTLSISRTVKVQTNNAFHVCRNCIRCTS